jgi:hypothetical protein
VNFVPQEWTWTDAGRARARLLVQNLGDPGGEPAAGQHRLGKPQAR